MNSFIIEWDDSVEGKWLAILKWLFPLNIRYNIDDHLYTKDIDLVALFYSHLYTFRPHWYYVIPENALAKLGGSHLRFCLIIRRLCHVAQSVKLHKDRIDVLSFRLAEIITNDIVRERRCLLQRKI